MNPSHHSIRLGLAMALSATLPLSAQLVSVTYNQGSATVDIASTDPTNPLVYDLDASGVLTGGNGNVDNSELAGGASPIVSVSNLLTVESWDLAGSSTTYTEVAGDGTNAATQYLLGAVSGTGWDTTGLTKHGFRIHSGNGMVPGDDNNTWIKAASGGTEFMICTFTAPAGAYTSLEISFEASGGITAFDNNMTTLGAGTDASSFTASVLPGQDLSVLLINNHNKGNSKRLTKIKMEISGAVSAGGITKDDNTDNLNLGTSWVGGTGPDSSEDAIFDATLTGPLNYVLGADRSWGGIDFTDAGGNQTIDAGNTLTLGTAGITVGAGATADLTINADVDLAFAQTWDVISPRVLTLGGSISGAVGSSLSLSTDANGAQFVFNGQSTYDGFTILMDGELIIGVDDALPTHTNLRMGGGGSAAILNLNGHAQTIRSIAANASGTRRVYGIGGTPSTLTINTLVDQNSNSTFGLGDTGDEADDHNNFAVVKSGPGQQRFSTSTFHHAGNTTIQEGALALRLVPPNSPVVLDGGVFSSGGGSFNFFDAPLDTIAPGVQWTANGGGFSAWGTELTVDIGGSGDPLDWGTNVGTELVGPLKFGHAEAENVVTFNNPINLNGATRTIEVTDNPGKNNDRAELVGVLADGSGTGSLNKTGTGELTLSASNTYTGSTSVQEGTLLVGPGGTISGPVTVAAGATLGGGGNLNGAVTIDTGGTIAPGASIDTLAAGSDVTINGTFSVEVDGTTTDLLEVTGTLDITNATLDVSTPGAGATEAAYVIASYGTLTGATFAIVNAPSGYTVDYNYLSGNQIALVQSGDDYDTWGSAFWIPGDPNTGAAEDFDSNGVDNQTEYAFGLNPTDPMSINPISIPLDASGKFTYTRRLTSLSMLTYTVETSTNLQTWAPDAGASQTQTGVSGEVETIEVSVTASPAGGKLFARIVTNP